jgi:hypothetical protein
MPADLSGGMSRRVALARAIAADPMLTMYDEPFAGLDPITLNVIAELVRKLNDAIGTTSIVVTYDVSESLKVVDYIYVISDGVVVGEGTPDEVASSEDPYLKQFMHALPDGPVRFHFPGRPLEEELRLVVELAADDGAEHAAEGRARDPVGAVAQLAADHRAGKGAGDGARAGGGRVAVVDGSGLRGVVDALRRCVIDAGRLAVDHDRAPHDDAALDDPALDEVAVTPVIAIMPVAIVNAVAETAFVARSGVGEGRGGREQRAADERRGEEFGRFHVWLLFRVLPDCCGHRSIVGATPVSV